MNWKRMSVRLLILFRTYKDEEKQFKENEEVWKMTLDEAQEYFQKLDKSISEVCKTASRIMLGHLHMGQAIRTLSGGENIRVQIMKAAKSKSEIIVRYCRIGIIEIRMHLRNKFICGILNKIPLKGRWQL